MATAGTYKPISWILLRSDDLTIWTRSEHFRVRCHTTPKNPKTADQRATRSNLTEAKRQWSTLSPSDKQVWKQFGIENFWVNKHEHFKTPRGIDTFVRASIMRQMAGLSAMPELPKLQRPELPTALDLLPGSDPRELAFRIEHGVRDVSSHAMLVRMTPTGESPTCRPYQTSLRYVRGVGRDSIIPLPESGATVRIPGTRFALTPGHQYAIEVRIVRLPDGAASDPRYHAAIREEEAPAMTNAAAPAEVSQSQPREQLTKLAEARGSEYFPSAYVQLRYYPNASSAECNKAVVHPPDGKQETVPLGESLEAG